MSQQQLSVITHSSIVSRIQYTIRPTNLGRLPECCVKNRIDAFFKHFKRFNYINCTITISHLSDLSNYERLKKIWCTSDSLHRQQMIDLRARGHPFQLPECATDLLLSDFCMNMLNNIP